ncbi:hypothetical protein C4B60_13100 [Jeotgalibacillus proteolyticus]|uniref:Glycosyl transferase family 28 C-terminal domain-containing protein n=2 Tax=Jeotgalibacillus proteolyticus TaxID=2082395 RepID=A0A2S5GC91_9BACL|nr:hypothetical protein C4B60_13100 [Jeotgalibacillus proteolyticus]
MDIQLPNVVKIPSNYTESQNYIAASDLVITKAGWGTVSEAVIFQKPLLLVDRMYMNEDYNTVNYLKEINHVKLTGLEELKTMVINEDLFRQLAEQETGISRENAVYMIVERILKIVF